MAGFDWTNPFPMQFGGDPTEIENVHLSLREMTGGETGGPGPLDGVDDSLRQAKATSIAFADAAVERAFLQAFPNHATDALPLWEKLLLTSGADDTEVALREALTVAYRSPNGATTPHLIAALTAISPLLSIELEDPDETVVAIPGKYFAPDDNVPPFYSGLSTHVSARKPNFSSRDILRVVYALPVGETVIPDDIVELVTVLLTERLPSRETWTLTTLSPDGPGFFLDGGISGDSLLDLTPLG